VTKENKKKTREEIPKKRKRDREKRRSGPREMDSLEPNTPE